MALCAIMKQIIPGSSMVEQEAVNFEVTGSSPVRGATRIRGKPFLGLYFCPYESTFSVRDDTVGQKAELIIVPSKELGGPA